MSTDPALIRQALRDVLVECGLATPTELGRRAGTTRRVSDEQLEQMIREIIDEDERAKKAGQAHGDYGEDFGAVVFDLRDARAEIERLKSDRRALVEAVLDRALPIMQSAELRATAVQTLADHFLAEWDAALATDVGVTRDAAGAQTSIGTLEAEGPANEPTRPMGSVIVQNQSQQHSTDTKDAEGVMPNAESVRSSTDQRRDIETGAAHPLMKLDESMATETRRQRDELRRRSRG